METATLVAIFISGLLVSFTGYANTEEKHLEMEKAGKR
jgi:hypothetical protein